MAQPNSCTPLFLKQWIKARRIRVLIVGRGVYGVYSVSVLLSLLSALRWVNHRLPFCQGDCFYCHLCSTAITSQLVCFLWHVVVNGRLDLVPHGPSDARRPFIVAVLHRLNVVFVVCTKKAHYGPPNILEFGSGLPVNTYKNQTLYVHYFLSTNWKGNHFIYLF